MTEKLNSALNNLDMLYSDINNIAYDIVSEYTKNINPIIDYAKSNIETLSNDDIRKCMLNLSIEGFSFSEVKERSAFKAECADILKKEAYARQFSSTDGSVAAKDTYATMNSSAETLAKAITEASAALLKIKLDEIHRVVDTLKTVLMSRMSEAKLTMITDMGQE